MSAGPAQLLSESVNESLKLGIVIYTVEQVFQVMTDNDLDGSAIVLDAPGLPQPRSAILFNDPVYCISRKPFRVDTQSMRKKWNVACTFTNDTQAFAHATDGTPVSNPTGIAPVIEIDYLKREEPITDAEFLNVTVGPFHESHEPTDVDPFAVSTENLLADPPWLARTKGPVVNSAGRPRYATAPTYTRQITLKRYIRNWDDALFDYLGAINDAEVTVKQFDALPTTGVAGDPALRYLATFDPLTLRVADVTKTDIYVGGLLFFMATIVVEENKKTWVHSELDVGKEQRVFVGQNKVGGGEYTIDELATFNPTIGESGHGWISIAQNGQPVDQANLNGYGAPLPLIRDPVGIYPEEGEMVYVNFKVGSIIDYSDLGFE